MRTEAEPPPSAAHCGSTPRPHRPVCRARRRRIPQPPSRRQGGPEYGERLIDVIDEGFDVAIRLNPSPDSSLIVRSLATWRHVLCCSPSYLEIHGRPRQLSELAEHNCVRHVLYPIGDEWHFVDRKDLPAKVRVSGNLITNSAEMLRRAALDGIGVALMGGFLIHDDLEDGRLVRLLPEHRPVELAMKAVYPHRHHLSARVRTFIDMLVHHSIERQKPVNPYS